MRPRRSRAACAGVLTSVLLLVGCASDSANHTARNPAHKRVVSQAQRAAVPDGDWLTFDYDSRRSGVGPKATGITSANIKELRLRRVKLPGVADSSAIQLHAVNVGGKSRDVDIVTTTYGRTVAFDPATGRRLWQYAPKDIGHYQGSAQITTASPVADPGRHYIYAASPDGFIHKLALANGHQVWARRVTFSPVREKIGPALNTSGPYLLVATGGYNGDHPIYEGHVVAIDRASGRIAHVWNAECSNRHHLLHPPSSCKADITYGGSAIWGRAGVVVQPSSHRLLVATGNGPFNGHTNWGDSVLELTPDASRLLHNWTPKDQAVLNRDDLDLGSTAPVLLPGTALAVQGGKAGKLDLLYLHRLDGTTGGPSPKTGGQLQTIAAPGSSEVLTAPVAFREAGKTYVIVTNDSATASYELSHRRLHRVWERPGAGTSPVIASGLLFVYNELRGRLLIMHPVSGKTLASLPAAPGHWSSPIVIGGRIILPVGGSPVDNALRGEVLVYHLPGR
jgi:outer membrane protein assembly factor BamB